MQLPNQYFSLSVKVNGTQRRTQNALYVLWWASQAKAVLRLSEFIALNQSVSRLVENSIIIFFNSVAICWSHHLGSGSIFVIVFFGHAYSFAVQ